jgi:hypothetical protein
MDAMLSGGPAEAGYAAKEERWRVRSVRGSCCRAQGDETAPLQYPSQVGQYLRALDANASKCCIACLGDNQTNEIRG